MKGFFSKPVAQVFALLVALLFMAESSTATTAVMVSDEELATGSRVIILGEVKSVKSQWDFYHQNIYTYVKVQVSSVIKGELQNEQIVFKQLGGTVGDESTIIFGAPEYEVGQRVLLFLDTNREGVLRITHLFQGKYDVIKDDSTGQERIERRIDGDEVNILGQREGPEITNRSSLKRFVKKVKRLLREKAAKAADFEARFADTPIIEVPPEYIDDVPGESNGDGVSAQYTFLGAYRWFQPDSGQPVTYRVNPAGAPIANGGNAEINQAMAAWSSVQTTALVIQNAGATSAFGFQRDGVSAISYDDPLDQMSDPSGCGGTLAIGGVSSAGGTLRQIGGQSFYQIFEGDVVFNRNFSCFLGISANLAEVACHEIGHSIGFGHSPDINAIMYASAHGRGRGATLGADDIAAVTFLYPGTKTAPPPPPPPTTPASPSGLTAAAQSSTTINLSWGDNSSNESGFRLERKTGATGGYSLIATLSAGQTSYSNTGLAASTTYYYRVKAYNSAGESGYSNETFATTTQAGTRKAACDFDRDGKADLAVWRPVEGSAQGMWYISNSSNGAPRVQSWGLNGDIPVAADYDGDGRTDLAIWRPVDGGAQGMWYIIQSSTGGARVVSWGLNGDKPVPADYDGDGKADLGIWRASEGRWYIIQSLTGAPRVVSWGLNGDKAVPADYDGDGKADVAVWRPVEGSAQGMWYIKQSSNGAPRVVSWGLNGDRPVPADYDGDGRADLGIWRASEGRWYVINSSTGVPRVVSLGINGDVPVAADYDGDGKADLAVWRPASGSWYIIQSSNGAVRTAQWGRSGDKPVPGL